VFLDTLTEVFRAITTTTPFSTFEQKPSGGIPNDIAALKGARLVMASEGEQGKRMAEAVLKRVTGRDLIAARFMRQEFFEFRPSFLLQMATNFEPTLRGQDDGLWRRVKLIQWEQKFDGPRRDNRLPDKLMAEAPGILAWAIRGAREWYATGLADPTKVAAAASQYRASSDVLQGFIPGAYVYGEAENSVTGKALWNDFRAWAEEENLRDLQGWSQRAFYGALKERGLHQKRDSSGAKFTGIKRAPRVQNTPHEDSPKLAQATTPSLAVSSATPQIAGPSLDAI
jgi:putative DNA primase/helicase